jgi:hypothetical protein
MGKKTVGFADEDDVDEVDDAQDEQQGRRFTANRELRCLPLAWRMKPCSSSIHSCGWPLSLYPCPWPCRYYLHCLIGHPNPRWQELVF